MKIILFMLAMCLLLRCSNLNNVKSNETNETNETCPEINITTGSGTEKRSGITIVKKGTVTTEDEARVLAQVKSFAQKASCESKKLFAAKKIIIGIVDHEEHSEVLGFFANRKTNGYDGLELIYTDPNGDGNGTGQTADNETFKTTTYEKLMQVFAYYVATSSITSELKAAYDDIKKHTGINYDNCAAYANAVQSPPCPQDRDNASDGPGPDEDWTRDEVHPAGIDLNPGAVLGKIYEYKIDPENWAPPGEFRGTLETDYNLTDSQFDKMKSFLKKYFGV